MQSTDPAPVQQSSAGYYGQERSEVMEFIPADARRVLDVGCGWGGFGRGLKNRFKAEVWGIEYQPPAAERARSGLDRVLAGDVMTLVDELPTSYFDVMVFNDVLEHLVDPYTLLLKIKRCLSPGGRIVCSIPNVLYFNALRSIVIHKDFKYEDEGIFDRTHLRFFTRKSILRMFDQLGYDVERIEGINPKRKFYFELLNFLLLNFLETSRHMQYVCVARPRAPSA